MTTFNLRLVTEIKNVNSSTETIHDFEVSSYRELAKVFYDYQMASNLIFWRVVTTTINNDGTTFTSKSESSDLSLFWYLYDEDYSLIGELSI
jgi:hypothetical protein